MFSREKLKAYVDLIIQVKGAYLVAISILVATSLVTVSFAQTESTIPPWIKNTAAYWINDHITDQEFLNALQYLVNEGVLVIPSDEEELDDTEHSEDETPDEETKTIHNLDILQFKIEIMQELAKHPDVIQAVKDSNEQFKSIENPNEYIDGIDNEWKSIPLEEVSPFMGTLIENKLSDLLRTQSIIPSEEFGDILFPEIIVTNIHGANVAQTIKTSDYDQADEGWWIRGTNETILIRDVVWDESAKIYSSDIVVRITDENGNFIGILNAATPVR